MSGASECRGNKRRMVKVSKAGGALEKRIKFKKLASVKPEERQARSCLEKAKVKDRALNLQLGLRFADSLPYPLLL